MLQKNKLCLHSSFKTIRKIFHCGKYKSEVSYKILKAYEIPIKLKKKKTKKNLLNKIYFLTI